ncbi:MAG TPA: DNA-binding response regulator [Planctomycetaceae bacterium]|nr:DNA-binding response regulator [Planctomycetaceae bacterium]
MRPHILVVEDEKHLGVGIKYNLEAEGYRVTLCEDGPTALRMFGHTGEGICLVILDLMLPGMSGYAVCESIRNQGSRVPVLMLSARTLAEDRTRGFNVGANQYMSKPFDLDELLSRVKNLMQLYQAPTNNLLTAAPSKPKQITTAQFGQVTVNFETHQATSAGKNVRMTPKELRLLRYLVENPQRVISRGELLSEVWEMNGNLQTRAVDQFVVRLRKIIEADPASPRHLLTIRDAGYRFIPEPQLADAENGDEKGNQTTTGTDPSDSNSGVRAKDE